MRLNFFLVLVFSLLSLWLFSCTQKEKGINYLSDQDFKISQQLNPEKLPLLNKVYAPVGMLGMADGLLIYDDGMEDSLFHYIKMEGSSLISDYVYGRKGRGDKEFTFPAEDVFSPWKNGYYIADHLSVRFYDSISQENHHPSYIRKKVTPKIGIYQGGVILGDSSFFGYAMGDSQKEFVFSKLDSEELEFFGDFFEVPVAITSPSIAIQVYSKMFTSNPSQGKVAVFYHNAKRFKIFDASSDFEHKEFIFSDQAPLSVKSTDSQNIDMTEVYCYYSRIYSSDNFIFVLYYGEIDGEIGNNKNIKAKVHVFDWEGKAIADFQLQDIYSTFCVAGDSIIYAASPFDIAHIDTYKFKLQ